MKYRIVIEQDEDRIFVASCPSLSGCHSQGVTRREAVANIKEAVEGYQESLMKVGDTIPASTTEEIIDVDIQKFA